MASRWNLATLAPAERGSDRWTPSLLLRGLNEDVADAGVAGLGDGAEASSVSGGVLARDEADVGHELARVLEATQVPELGGDDLWRPGS